MEKKSLSWLVFSIVCALLFFSGQSVGARADLPQWPHEKSDLQPDPALRYGRLENGFRYVLMKNTTPTDRVSIHLDVQAGSLNETENQRGLAHFLEHMLFQGSEHFPPGELVKYFQRIGMGFGPDANAHTSFTETVYDILLPDGEKSDLEEALVVIHDYAAGALLLPEEIDRERQVILAEKRTRDSVSYRTFVKTFRFEFPGARVAKRMPIGLEEVIRKADRPLLKAYYDSWYRPDHMILVMVGDFDLDFGESLIQKKFADLAPRAPQPSIPDPKPLDHQGIKPFYHYEKEAGNSRIAIEVVRAVPYGPDSRAWQKKRLLGNMANRIVQDRLDARLRKPDVPFTAASIGASHFINAYQYAEISAECGPEKWEKSLQAIEQSLRRAIEHGFTAAELERVKKDYLTQLRDGVKSASTRESNHLSRQIYHRINRDRVFQSPSQRQALLSPWIQAATPEAVHQALRDLWSPDHRLVILTGNAEIKQDAPESVILAAFKQSRTVKTEPPQAEKALAFPYLPLPEDQGEITSKNQISDLDIRQIDFANRLRLNLKQTDFQANQIVAKLIFGPGRAGEPADKPGLAQLSEAVINESGLGGLNADQLEKALAGKQTRVTFGIQEDCFYLKGHTTPEELPLMFQLMHAYLLDPAFRPEAYQLAMKRFEQEYESLSRSVDGAMILKGRRFLAGGDSRFGLPPWKRFKDLRLSDVEGWVKGLLSQGKLELSVVGDMDPEAVTAAAGRYLGTLKRPGTDGSKRPQGPAFPRGESLDLEVNTQIPKGLVVAAWESADIWDISRTRRFSALAGVFDDRLRERIREQLGAAYSPSAFNTPSRAYPGYGLFQTYIHVDPQKAQTVLDAVKAIAADIRDQGISADELRRAVDPMLTGIKEMRQQNRYWLETVLSGSRDHPEQLEWSRTIEADYQAITRAELEKLAREYLDPKAAATITVIPVPPQ